MIEYDAIYVQLMKSLKEKMIHGEYRIGDKLDSERVMAAQYGINRMTVRNALKALEEEGYVKAYRGRGTFVARIPEEPSRKIEIGADSGAGISLSRGIRQRGYRSSRDVISFEKCPAEGEIKEMFPYTSHVFVMLRLSKINDRPYAVQKTYIPAEVFWDADRYDFAEGSLYDYMDTKDRYPAEVESYLRIDLPPAEYAQLLDNPPDKKVFAVTYLAYDRQGLMIEYTLSYHLPQYTSFTYVTERKI